MKKFKNKIIATSVVAIIMTAFNVNISNAVLESRPDSASLLYEDATDFFGLIRKMETADGPLGLNATVSDDGTETSSSNNIDVHMIKNTEYGTVGMLAASVYGAKNGEGVSNGTTTGNASGVYQMGTNENGDRNEFTTGILGEASGSDIKDIRNAPPKYWNNYTLEKKSIPGDGTLEIGWITRSWWLGDSQRVFYRSKTGGVFFYETLYYKNTGTSRAVVVSGAGI